LNFIRTTDVINIRRPSINLIVLTAAPTRHQLTMTRTLQWECIYEVVRLCCTSRQPSNRTIHLISHNSPITN